MTMQSSEKEFPIVFFDGVCNLCNSTIQLIIKYDKKSIFKFSSLQSNTAKQILNDYELDLNKMPSIVLVQNSKIYTKSTAVLTIFKQLNKFWPLYYLFILIPKFFRDWIYNIIAKNRYKWYGKQKSCWVPSPELNNKFLS